jgi:protein tyrosine phosphatase (PTP) superfamily phosphohydrolase (DUF442 family)
MNPGGDDDGIVTTPAHLATFCKLEQGDRIVMDSGEQVVITAVNTSPHNFGPASGRDETVFTCQRPGGDAGPGRLDMAQVLPEWIEFIKHQNGVTHVIILMGKDELDEAYEGGKDDSMIQTYANAGMTSVHHVPMTSPGAHDTIMAILDDLHSREGERVTCHCTHGMGRSSRVAAAWLVHHYQLSCEQATIEVLATARACGVERMGAPRLLQEWMSK